MRRGRRYRGPILAVIVGIVASVAVPVSAVRYFPLTCLEVPGRLGVYDAPNPDPTLEIFVSGTGTCSGAFEGVQTVTFRGEGIACASINVITGEPCSEYRVRVSLSLTKQATGKTQSRTQDWIAPAIRTNSQAFAIHDPKGGGAGLVHATGSATRVSGCPSIYYPWDGYCRHALFDLTFTAY